MPTTRLIFMGTPDFAVPSLTLLLDHGYDVAAVVTAPDRPRGRGQVTTPCPMKAVAQEYQLPVLQPTNLQAPDFVAALQHYQAQLHVVVAFRMLPRAVWAMPAWGTVNLHASLLPAYRGAAPIHWAIINGEQVTGVTTFLIEEKMDTGQLLFQESEPIHAHDTAGTLHERLKHKGAQLMLKTVQAMENGTHTPTHQAPTPASQRKQAPKIYKQDCQINWRQEAAAIVNFVRGLSPHPAAWTDWGGKVYKILAATVAQGTYPPLQPGQGYTDGKRRLLVGTQTAPVAVSTLQPAGKRPMDTAAFLRGNRPF